MMRKENRAYRMYLEDMNLAMERIAEYIHGLSSENNLVN